MSYQPPSGPPPPPSGPPPQGYPDPQQPWSQQVPWPHQEFDPSLPPKKRGNGWKWALGAVAVLVVIGVTAAVTISVTSDGGDGNATPSGETYGLASADDKGPVNIITEDPSCAAWRPINKTFVEIQRKGWDRRDPAIPASDWSPDARAQYEEVAEAARNAADQTVPLARLTPHRVMRELYEQFIAYSRAYSEAVPTYTKSDDHLAGVAVTTSIALVNTCAAIEWDSAQARAPLVPAPSEPDKIAAPMNPSEPERFMLDADPTCPEWYSLLAGYNTDTKAWQSIDPNLPASAWTPEQREVADAVIPVMKSFADDVENLGRRSVNPTVQDFATFAAQYRRAYASSIATYTSADSFLDATSFRTTSTIYEACKAAEG